MWVRVFLRLISLSVFRPCLVPGLTAVCRPLDACFLVGNLFHRGSSAAIWFIGKHEGLAAGREVGAMVNIPLYSL